MRERDPESRSARSAPTWWSRGLRPTRPARKITLAVSRLKHSSPDSAYQGVMLVNPGGPGGSGLIYSVFGEGSFIPGDGDISYDWIGFDPRGVGDSKPALTCDAELLRLRPAQLHPVHPRPGASTGCAGRRTTPRPARTPRPRSCSTTSRPPTTWPTWRACARRWGDADQLLRLLVRHDLGAGLCDAAPATGSAASSSTATSTRAGSGTSPTSTRTWPSRRRSTSTSAGWPSTTTSTTSARPRRPWPNGFYRERTKLDQNPGRRRIGPDELTDVLLVGGLLRLRLGGDRVRRTPRWSTTATLRRSRMMYDGRQPAHPGQ